MGDDIAAKRKQLIKNVRGLHDAWARQEYEKDKGRGSCAADTDLIVPCPGDRLLTFGVFSPMNDLAYGDDEKQSKTEYYTWFNRAYARRRGADASDTWPDDESELPLMRYSDLNSDVRRGQWESDHPGQRYSLRDSTDGIRRGGKDVHWTVENYRLQFVENAVNQDRGLSEDIAAWKAKIKCDKTECDLQILEGDKGDPLKPNAWEYVARDTNIHISEGAHARTRVAVCIKFFAICTLKREVPPQKPKKYRLWYDPRFAPGGDPSAPEPKEVVWEHIIATSLGQGTAPPGR